LGFEFFVGVLGFLLFEGSSNNHEPRTANREPRTTNHELQRKTQNQKPKTNSRGTTEEMYDVREATASLTVCRFGF
jgi:hypothetical protein